MQFEREMLAVLGMPREIVMRHRMPHFLHVFGGDGYSAAYYSYLWADTLVADAWEAFVEAGGPWMKWSRSDCASIRSRSATRSTQSTATEPSAVATPGSSGADAEAWVREVLMKYRWSSVNGSRGSRL